MAAKYQHVDVMALLMGAGVVDTGEARRSAMVHAGRWGGEAAVKLLRQQAAIGRGPRPARYCNFRDTGVVAGRPLSAALPLVLTPAASPDYFRPG